MLINAVIDRFEGNKAVLELDDDVQINWPSSQLPAEASEGSWLDIEIKVNSEKTQEAQAQADSLLQRVLAQNG